MLEKDINNKSSFVVIGEYRTNDLSIYINSIVPSKDTIQNLPNDVEVLNKVYK